VSNPPSNSAPTNTRRRQYRIGSISISEINRVLQDIGLRLDQVDAIGQDPDIKGRILRNLSSGTLARLSTDNLTEGNTNLYFTSERVDDRVAALLQAGSAITLTHDDVANTLTVAVKIKAAYGIDVDADGLKLKQQSHIADAAAVSALSLVAGADTVDMAAFNTALGTLVTEINAIKTAVNTILTNMEGAEINATS
jgi:hypothetical protein